MTLVSLSENTLLQMTSTSNTYSQQFKKHEPIDIPLGGLTMEWKHLQKNHQLAIRRRVDSFPSPVRGRTTEKKHWWTTPT